MTATTDDRFLATIDSPSRDKLTDMARTLTLLPGKAFYVVGKLPDDIVEGQEFDGCIISRAWDSATKSLKGNPVMTKI